MTNEYEVIAKIDGVCKNILNVSRSQLYVNMRYLGMAFNGLAYALSDDTETLGTDGFYLYYSPAFLMQKYQQEAHWIDRAYIHVILHCIFKHLIGMEDRDEDLWNISCDIVTEFIIDKFNNRLLKRNISTLRRRVYKKIEANIKVPTAESVYRFLINNEKLTDIELEKIGQEFLMDDHSFWVQYQTVTQPMDSSDEESNNEGEGDSDADNSSKGNGDGSNNNSKPKRDQEDFNEKWRQISQKTETDMETFSKNQSDEAQGMTEFLRIENRQRYDYREFLKKFTVLREEMQLDLDSYDYIYYTYGLKVYGNMPLIENLEYKETNKIDEFVIVIDTSASCESELVRKFLEETYSILRDNESYFRKVNLHVIQCDNKIQSDEVIVCKEDFEQYMNKFEIKGRGGTDFTVAFSYVNKLCDEKQINNLKGLIYFTDGYGAYPKNMPNYEVAFVFMDESYEDKGVPPWATEIVIGREDLYKV